ncbi:MAG: formylglycine-generating enzyme family protein, partial [Planctomycetia bacterium]|nr:formylglycine-generating enzyme family protein [Planctomycetia bacterium]
WTGKLNNKVSISFSLIPPGRFLMGSLHGEQDRYDNEGPRHEVTITRPFYLGIYPVTQAQWTAVMGDRPFRFLGPDRPADSITAHGAEHFCHRASEALGREVRLPFEAEWEHACRGGTRSMFYIGNQDHEMRKAIWCSRSGTGSGRYTKKVGTYLPNPWGLYDMSGNVREWCADDQRQYTSEAQIDPRGPISLTNRITRGGSWYYTAEDSRSASRYQRPMDYQLDYYGFRVAMPCE